MTPLVKNVVLAFVAGAVSSLSAFAVANPQAPTDRKVVISVGVAAAYAGIRGVIGYLKATYGSAPFAVDTEA
jgi:coenzyme F420-reducing hydrogenase gamma subunit